MHLRFQEFLSAKFLARLLGGGIAELGAWLQACAGDSWWSQVLLMTFEILSSDQRSVKGPQRQVFDALLDTLADDPQAQLHEGNIAELSYPPSAGMGTKVGRTYVVVRPIRWSCRS